MTEGRDGRVLLMCWAGCRTEDVVRAIGLQMADLFPQRDKRRPFTRRPRRAKVAVPRSVAEILTETSEFGVTWEAAKQLAKVEPVQMRLDVLSAWDLLTETTDIRSVLELAYLLRGISVFRYCNSKTIGPRTIASAVTRLLEETGDAAA
ncbi:MAG: hypothetical protein M3P01_04135 [Actinomycetota bacterium]|nr:hypothetical protein [Actinomycetota bacterium]